MKNELFTADLEVRLRSAEANMLLRRFREHRSAASGATVAMLDREVMRIYGANLVMLERAADGEFTILYHGRDVPDDAGQSLSAKTTAAIEPETAALYRLGCEEAGRANDAVCINHQSILAAPIHRWECLFLPLMDGESQRLFVALCIPRQPKHEFLRLMLDALPNAAMVATPVRDRQNDIVDAAVVAANARAVEFTGHASLAALLASPLSRIFVDAQSSSSWDRNLTVLRSGKAQTFDFHYRGETVSRWLQVQVAPIRDGIVISMIEISEMKRAFLELEHQKKVLMDEMEQRRGLEQELWALAHLDPLTGLPNRRAFRDAGLLKLAESQSAQRPCAIITIDIDHFKRVNDAFGHGAGDTVLRRVADIIKAPLRPTTDIGARMGGEEFVVMLPETDNEAAVAFAEKLRRRIEQTVVIVGEHEVRPTISLGVALSRKSVDLDDLIDRADRALYAAKRSGRNKVVSELDVPDTLPKRARPPSSDDLPDPAPPGAPDAGSEAA